MRAPIGKNSKSDPYKAASRFKLVNQGFTQIHMVKSETYQEKSLKISKKKPHILCGLKSTKGSLRINAWRTGSAYERLLYHIFYVLSYEDL